MGGWNVVNPYGYPATCMIPVAVTTDIYMASSLGLPLFSPAQDLATIGDPASAVAQAALGNLILWRADGSAIKSFEAYASCVAMICAGHGGYLPSRCAATTATRVIQQ